MASFNQTADILMANGGYFNFLEPEKSDAFTIKEVALGLARECRFGNQLPEKIEVYTVAQHCVLMSFEAPDDLRLAALLHEVEEGFFGDMVGPLKRICPDYKKLSKAAVPIILDRLGHGGLDVFSAEIKDLDNRMLATEQRDLCAPHDGGNWALTHNVHPFSDTITPWSIRGSYTAFMERYWILTHG